jgi:hypothetical protein
LWRGRIGPGSSTCPEVVTNSNEKLSTYCLMGYEIPVNRSANPLYCLDPTTLLVSIVIARGTSHMHLEEERVESPLPPSFNHSDFFLLHEPSRAFFLKTSRPGASSAQPGMMKRECWVKKRNLLSGNVIKSEKHSLRVSIYITVKRNKDDITSHVIVRLSRQALLVPKPQRQK